MIQIPLYNSSAIDAIPTASFFPLFSPEECQAIIDKYTDETPVTAMIDGEIIDKRRSTLIHPIPYTEEDEDNIKLWMTIADRVGRYNNVGYDFDVSGMYNDMQLLEYNEGDYYDWHMDIGSGPTALRKLSVIIQLTDPEDYEGGEVIFKASETERTLPKDRGQIAVFPSYVLHKVQPVTKGTRHALVTWIMGQRRFR